MVTMHNAQLHNAVLMHNAQPLGTRDCALCDLHYLIKYSSYHTRKVYIVQILRQLSELPPT